MVWNIFQRCSVLGSPTLITWENHLTDQWTIVKFELGFHGQKETILTTQPYAHKGRRDWSLNISNSPKCRDKDKKRLFILKVFNSKTGSDTAFLLKFKETESFFHNCFSGFLVCFQVSNQYKVYYIYIYIPLSFK